MSSTHVTAIQQAIQLHVSGKLDEAERIYRSILAAQPQEPNCLHMLGLLLARRGDAASAESLIHRSLELAPNRADFYSNYGLLRRNAGRHEEALAYFQRAVALDANNAGFHLNIGLVLEDLKRPAEAADAFALAVAMRPDFAAANERLGWSYLRQYQLMDAIALFEKAVQIDPGLASAHDGLCVALSQIRQFDEAILYGHRAVELNPNNADAHMNLGGALAMQGRLDEALDHIKNAVQLAPTYVQALTNLARVFKLKGDLENVIVVARHMLSIDPNCVPALSQLSHALLLTGDHDQAIDLARRAVEIEPNFIRAWMNLAMALLGAGDVAQSIAATRHTLELVPDFSEARSDLVFALHYDPEIDRQLLFEEHRKFQAICVNDHGITTFPPENSRDPDRPLRIAYVSPDFRQHAVADFLEPVLRSHNREQFVISCYSDVRWPDDVTRRFKAYANCWYDTADLNDLELAQKINGAQEDIVIDLAGHTGQNRMLAFASRPAPVQASYLGWLDTTGLDAMGYRIADAITNPPGQDESLYTEELVRLPCFFCFQPPSEAPAVGELPSKRDGRLTFGCLNHPAKFNHRVIALWARLLQKVPDSRIVLTSHSPRVSQQQVRTFESHGIRADRINFLPRRLRPEYYDSYNTIDIALDPFPFNGHTTSCDALWMGVPVITVTGNSYCSRTCTSTLTHLGLTELIAKDHEQFIQIAFDLARDAERLAQYRSTLRQRVSDSVITDAAKFTASLENAYRDMWRRWCAGEKQ